MASRTGVADLPLHGGRAPRWLFERMSRLAPAVVEAVVLEEGPAAVLERLSDPWWFQAFGCVLGFDWHSSGVTTTVCGALKAGLAGREADVGLWVAGGKGRASRRTPDELGEIAGRLSLDATGLVRTSRTAASVDSAAVQDGFQLYHHVFFLTSAGEWAVVQQGMRDAGGSRRTGSRGPGGAGSRGGQARRYHWLGSRVTDLVNEPHAAVCSDERGGPVLNLVAAESAGSRGASVELTREDPARVLAEAKRVAASLGSGRAGRDPEPSAAAQTDLFGETDSPACGSDAASAPDAASTSARSTDRIPRLALPSRHHVVTAEDVHPRHLHKILTSTYESAPVDFEGLLAVKGVGAKGVRALALLAEVLYGEPASFRDPARFSFAHGGKDGFPYPVDRDTYDRSVAYLKEAVDRARVGRSDRVDALKRLARWEERGPRTPGRRE